MKWLVLCSFYLKIALRIVFVLSAIAIAFLVELLRGEYCINTVECINSSKMLRMQFPLIPLFCCSVIPCSAFFGLPYKAVN